LNAKPRALPLLLALLLQAPTLAVGPLAHPVLADEAYRGTDQDPGADEDDRDDEHGTVKVGDVASLYRAIATSPDGSKIRIDPGTYVLEEELRIEEKRLRISGSGAEKTLLVSPRGREAGILTYGGGGGGTLKHLSFMGGAFAIGSDREGRSLPSDIYVKDVSISRGYRGIYGAFSELSLKHVSVSHTQWTGISLTDVDSFAELDAVEVQGAGGVGLYLDNTGGGDVTIGGHYHHNAYAGVQVNGGTATFFFTVADHNGLFGVILWGVQAGMGLSALEDQIDAPPAYGNPGPGGCEGVGLAAVEGSSVSVAGSIFEDNCLGLAVNSDSSITSTQNTFSSTTGQIEGLAIDGPLTDGGGNVCGYNMGTPNEYVVDCSEFFIGAPQAPPPLGADALE
jgi:hypothetical protein